MADAEHNPDHVSDDGDDREVALDDPALPELPLADDEQELVVGDETLAPGEEPPDEGV